MIHMKNNTFVFPDTYELVQEEQSSIGCQKNDAVSHDLFFCVDDPTESECDIIVASAGLVVVGSLLGAADDGLSVGREDGENEVGEVDGFDEGLGVVGAWVGLTAKQASLFHDLAQQAL